MQLRGNKLFSVCRQIYCTNVYVTNYAKSAQFDSINTIKIVLRWNFRDFCRSFVQFLKSIFYIITTVIGYWAKKAFPLGKMRVWKSKNFVFKNLTEKYSNHGKRKAVAFWLKIQSHGRGVVHNMFGFEEKCWWWWARPGFEVDFDGV